MKLSELENNRKGIITKVRGRGAFRKRITEMGFVKGKEVTAIKNAPLNDPVEYHIMGFEISLRKSEAELIEIITEKEAEDIKSQYPNIVGEFSTEKSVITDDILKTSAKEKQKIINVALVGNPNSGKTTLFNFASHSREHVGNYGGVTVDFKTAKLKQNGYTFNITDLPGTYSLAAYSPEELYVRNYIFNNVPDIVINVVDASNLERNLFLTTQLIDMDIKVIVALNMYDELLKKGDKFDYHSLGTMIGIPFIPTVSSKGKGIKELFQKVIDVYEDKEPIVRHIHINYRKDIAKSINIIQEKIKIKQNYFLTDKISSRFLAIKLLEQDKDAHETLSVCKNYSDIKQTSETEIKKLEHHFNESSETIIIDAKYGFISGAIKETYKEGVISTRKRTEIIDTFITHKLFGFPIFILFMWIMFQATFSLGSYPMDWIEQFVTLISGWFKTTLPEGILKDLLIDGIISGVGSVIVFLPNILILFFFISLMEDTGYMARAAFIMDKLMHKIGLHGKSFIPLVMGFGCNVPAIMSTRMLENKNDRLLTMLINPFMSCSARLPVYVLLIGAFFPDYPGTILFSIYLIGIIMAIVVAIVLKKTIFKSKEAPFVMELPPYRIPALKTTLRNMWYKAEQYLKKIGGIVLIASIIIWALGYYPQNVKNSKKYDSLITQIEKEYAQKLSHIPTLDTLSISSIINEKARKINQIELNKKSEQQEKSFIGQIGHFIEPIIKPLGFDWKMGVSLLSGVAAKEIVVSTMAVLYQEDFSTEGSSETLINKLRNQTYTSGKLQAQKVFTPLIAFAFMVFILIYFPCIAVIVTIKKESGSWKWAIFLMLYTTTLAWVMSFLVYQVGSFF